MQILPKSASDAYDTTLHDTVSIAVLTRVVGGEGGLGVVVELGGNVFRAFLRRNMRYAVWGQECHFWWLSADQISTPGFRQPRRRHVDLIFAVRHTPGYQG